MHHTLIHKTLLKTSKKTAPQLHEIIQSNGPIKLKPRAEKEFFPFLIRTVIGQQLSKGAATSISQRITTEAEKREIDLIDLFIPQRRQVLRTCGLSNSKIRTLTGLRQSYLKGNISPLVIKKADYSTVQDLITNMWGFGEWSADMVALFFCGLSDIWPATDGAILRGLDLLSLSQDSKHIENLVPYRSYVALHIWRGLDTGKLKAVSKC